jgi:serine/threonine-protein kinase
VDGRTDEYALACVLFACLTGRPPFQGQVPEVIAGHLSREVPSVTGLVTLPGSIDKVIRTGMAKEPDGRYPDCRALIAAARSALASVARPGVPPSRSPVQPTSGPIPVQQPTRPQLNQQRPAGPHYPARGYPRPGPPPSGVPQPGGLPPVTGEPMRLRPPAPAGASAFTPERGVLSRWGVPILVGVAAIVVIIVLIIAFTGNSGGGTGSGSQDPIGSHSPMPIVPVGSGGGGDQGELPTDFPGRTGP